MNLEELTAALREYGTDEIQRAFVIRQWLYMENAARRSEQIDALRYANECAEATRLHVGHQMGDLLPDGTVN